MKHLLVLLGILAVVAFGISMGAWHLAPLLHGATLPHHHVALFCGGGVPLPC
jgi:hypothetical protein